MSVMFFVLINIEISTCDTFSLIAMELKNDGQHAPSDQEVDGPSWSAEMKVLKVWI